MIFFCLNLIIIKLLTCMQTYWKSHCWFLVGISPADRRSGWKKLYAVFRVLKHILNIINGATEKCRGVLFNPLPSELQWSELVYQPAIQFPELNLGYQLCFHTMQIPASSLRKLVLGVKILLDGPQLRGPKPDGLRAEVVPVSTAPSFQDQSSSEGSAPSSWTSL